MDLETLGILAALSFLPPVVFAIWVRNHERHQREPLLTVLGMFVYGGTLGIVGLGATLGPGAPVLASLVIIAPLAEELAKGFGLGFVKRRILELEDGLIYGAAIGLGFGATENLLYGYDSFLEGGLLDAAVTIALRTFSSALLHAGSTALLGYGYGLARLRRKGLAVVFPFYLLAVGQHALYNLLVSQGYLVAFLAALAMVVVVTTYLRRHIRRLDSGPRDWTQV